MSSEALQAETASSQEAVKTALLKTIEGIKSGNAAPNVVFRAATRLEENVRCHAKVRKFEMMVDEPPELAGGDTAMNPVELVLVALGTCQEIMYAAYASIMGVQLDELKVDVKGYLDLRGLFGIDETIPAGYKSIKTETHISSPSDEDSVRALVQAVESHCPVLDILAREQEISNTVHLNKQRLDI